jgi:chemotaxis protein CheC
MNLTEHQRDALTELINIGFARSGAALSDLTGHRILLNVPEVQIVSIEKLVQVLTGFVDGEVATLHQFFSGQVRGQAMLLLGYEGALLLTSLLTGEESSSNTFDASAAEVLTEVGNILLNACLGTFGNLLNIHISFSVPRLQLEALDGLMRSITVEHEELRYALFVYTTFSLRDSSVSGYLVLILGVTSLEKLLSAVESLG